MAAKEAAIQYGKKMEFICVIRIKCKWELMT
jgi:hypothetical protein